MDNRAGKLARRCDAAVQRSVKREDGVESGMTGVGLVRHRFNQFDTNKSKRK
jgi:hypothetical protein